LYSVEGNKEQGAAHSLISKGKDNSKLYNPWPCEWGGFDNKEIISKIEKR
jgi:hypothetical protein